MNPLQRMELHKDDFTQNDQIIYDCIMKNPAGITHMSTAPLQNCAAFLNRHFLVL